MTLAGRISFTSPALRACAAALLLWAWSPALAQQTGSIGPSAEKVAESRDASAREEYDRVMREIELSGSRAAQLSADIAKLKKDDATLTAALIQSAKTEKKLGEDVDAITARLGPLKEQEEHAHAALIARSDVLADVLGALQRMGLNPPPAILVSPDDALSSVRSAILLGAVVPEMRAETEALATTLREIASLSNTIRAERDRLTAAVEAQVAERRRLAILQDEKLKLRDQRAAEMVDEQARSEELAAKAKDLKGLIAALEKEQRRTEARKQAEKEREDALAAAPIPQENQLLGGLPFESLKGQLQLPAAGRMSLRYGDRRDNGAVIHGDTVATQSGAIVASPADGKVLFAGRFRSFGQILIVDAGNGYHIVLSGLGRITAAQGQAVLAGEPVGAMEDSRLASAAPGAGTGKNAVDGPELYVEFRKNGKPIDPAPWWAR